MSPQRAPDGFAPDLSGPQPRVDDIAARLEAQINLQRIEDGDQWSAAGADPLSSLRARQWVNSHLPIGWPDMPRGIGPKLVALLQKVTRRLLRWYINPLVAQQNEFNDAVVAALQDVYRHTAREVATATAECETLRLELARLQAAQALATPANEGASLATTLGHAQRLPLPYTPSLPSAAPERYDAVLRRVLFAQRLASEALPLLIIGDQTGELVARARAQGLAVEALPAFGSEHLDTPAASLSGFFWVSGVWRHDPTSCLRLLITSYRALAPGAPLVIETVTPSDADALARTVWADPAAVRPYPPELLQTLLRSAGLDVGAEPVQQLVGGMIAVHAYRGRD